MRGDDLTAVWLCLLAGATDFLDGGVARSLGQASRFGATLDPLADKFMLNVLYMTLWMTRGEWVAGVVLARDILILTGSALLFFATGNRDFPPSWPGKISTAIQIGWLIAILLGLSGGWKIAADTVLLTGTVGSGLDYIRRGLIVLRSHPAKSN